MSKPISLIVANRCHDVADKIAKLTPEQSDAWAKAEHRDFILEQQLRQLLCDVSHLASMTMIAKALAAVGAPATIGEMEQRVQAARDAQRAEIDESAGAVKP